MDKELKVAALCNGTVIDHIPSDKLFMVVSILQLKKFKHPLTIGNNFESEKVGTKGIIKISDRALEDDETNKIALIAPTAKINIIENYKVIQKKQLTLPSEVNDIVSCPNPKCITNHQYVKTRFKVLTSSGKYRLKCRYCEREIYQEEVVLIKNKYVNK